jgi:iron complex transport system permease protein
MAEATTSSRRTETAEMRSGEGLSAIRFVAVVGPCVLFLAVVLLITPLIGARGISLHGVLSGESTARDILLLIRLPRILFGALVGGSLAVAGVLFQAILRNTLATPFTLGISSGSTLGAVMAIWLGLDVVWWGMPIISLFAFAGALLTVFLVFFIARSSGGLPTFTLLLAGVTLNFVFGALVLFLHYASSFAQASMMTMWTMGSLNVVGYTPWARTVPIVLLAVGVVIALSPKLNLLAVGEDWASTRGVNVHQLKTLSYFMGSVLTGAVTAFSGPIGFVGLVVPHTLRMIAGPDHRILVPGSFFLGAAFLVLCDTAARTLLSPTEIPVGVITALLGGPFFIALLKKRPGELW